MTDSLSTATADITISLQDLHLPANIRQEALQTIIEAIVNNKLRNALKDCGIEMKSDPVLDISVSEDGKSLATSIEDVPVDDTLQLVSMSGNSISIHAMSGSASAEELALKNNAQRRMVIEISINKGCVSTDIRLCEKPSPTAETVQENRAQLSMGLDGKTVVRSARPDKYPIVDTSPGLHKATDSPTPGM